MANGKGSLRRPMAVEPDVFASNFARTFGTTAGTLKESRDSSYSTDDGAKRPEGDAVAEGSKSVRHRS
ncbi:MAG TPA: hypothetical protein VFK39_06720 [Gemmatimonadaceae bacterium]|nr:hypothetical protein [Gemmatimonadaceae bacterium]